MDAGWQATFAWQVGEGPRNGTAPRGRNRPLAGVRAVLMPVSFHLTVYGNAV